MAGFGVSKDNYKCGVELARKEGNAFGVRNGEVTKDQLSNTEQTLSFLQGAACGVGPSLFSISLTFFAPASFPLGFFF